jgi:hypothetical protein
LKALVTKIHQIQLKNVSIRHGIAFLEPRNVVLKGYGVEDLDLNRDRNFLNGLRLRLEYVPRRLVFLMLTVVSARMLRTSPRLTVKEMATGHRFLLLSPLLRQLSQTPNERRHLELTHHQQPVQTCHQFQVHPTTTFYLLPFPQSMANPIVHNR